MYQADWLITTWELLWPLQPFILYVFGQIHAMVAVKIVSRFRSNMIWKKRNTRREKKNGQWRLTGRLTIFTCIWSIYISQLMRYSRAYGSYQDFLNRGLLLTRKLLNQVNQGFLFVKLKSSLQKFYGRHHDLVDRYGISVSQMTTDMFHLS